jgi:activating signal cointegrator complex subunit 1
MGKKKGKGEYNDFLEDTKLRDNAEIRTTLQSTSTLTRNVSPPAPSKPQSQHHNNANSKGNPNKPPLTHFLCLPLISDSTRPQIAEGLARFQKDVEELTPVPVKAVRPVGTLHLTLGVMSLSTEQLREAMQYLQELDGRKLLHGITTQIIAENATDSTAVAEGFGTVSNPSHADISPLSTPDPDRLSIDLTRLVPMHTPSQTSILYAEPCDKSGRLQRFAESLRSGFEEKGLIVHDDRALRLHATVLNTVYAKPKGKARARSKGPPRTKTASVSDGAGIGADADADVDAGAVATNRGNDGETDKDDGKTGHGPNAKNWMRFDATELIERYKDFVWAEDVQINRVQICKMGAQKIFREGEEGVREIVDEKYEVVCEKKL